MKTAIHVVIVLATILYSNTVSVAQAGDSSPYDGQITLVVKHLPTFEDYPPEAEPSAHSATDIDWSADKSEWVFRTRLRQGLKKGANFNGHYAVVTYGCGTQCQGNKIIDVNTGKVIGGFTTSYGTAYRMDSSLIISDFPGAVADLNGEFSLLYKIRFLKVENDQLISIRTLNIHKMFEDESSNRPLP